ncbi:hypothetical protein D3C87_2108850 [compost metagenome]
MHAELELSNFAGTQLQLLTGYQVRSQGFRGALIETEEVGTLECNRVPELDKTDDNR